MSSKALQRYQSKLSDIRDLFEIADLLPGASKGERGRRSENQKVLHKSAIVLLTASWETYVENLLIESVDFLSSKAHTPDVLPIDLRKSISKYDKNELFHWQFSGDNWRIITSTYIRHSLRNFNTPKSSNIIEVFSSHLGIIDISKSWSRRNKAQEQAVETLDEWLNERHKIVHGDLSDPRYLKRDVISYQEFLEKTVSLTDEAVKKHLKKLVGIDPW